MPIARTRGGPNITACRAESQTTHNQAPYDTSWGRAEEEYDVEGSTEQPLRGDETIVSVGIVGAGLGGLALAIALRRNGIDCRVYEKATELRSNSQGMLSLQPNGMAALELIHPDLPRLIREDGAELLTTRSTQVQDDGTITSDTSNVQANEGNTPRMVLISWHRLQQVLSRLLPEEVIHTSHALRSYTEQVDAGSVRLNFVDAPPAVARLVLGTDGTFSAVRANKCIYL